MKRSLPILVGALALGGFAVAIFVILASKHDEETEITEATSQWFVQRLTKGGHREGTDFVVEKVLVVSKSPEGAIATAALSFSQSHADFEPNYAELVKEKDKPWRVVRDLHDHFDAYMAGSARQSEMSRRLATLVMERFGVAVEIPVGLPFTFQLGDDNREIVAHIATKPIMMGTVEGRYFESYRYRDGTWVSEGPGRLVEKPKE
jgi:hypothetical protein